MVALSVREFDAIRDVAPFPLFPASHLPHSRYDLTFRVLAVLSIMYVSV